MRSAIFYFSLKPGPERTPFDLPDGTRVYIRAEIRDGEDCSEALDNAQLQDGEVGVMNSHELVEAS